MAGVYRVGGNGVEPRYLSEDALCFGQFLGQLIGKNDLLINVIFGLSFITADIVTLCFQINLSFSLNLRCVCPESKSGMLPIKE